MKLKKTIKPVLETATIKDLEKELSVSDTPEEVLEFIKKYLQDVFNIKGNKKEIRFVLDTLITQCQHDDIKNNLYKIRTLTWE